MFDFEKLEVYRAAKELNKEALLYMKARKEIDSYLRDQWRRASISSVINIAEGSGKFGRADKRNFYTIARGSVYECVAIMDIVRDSDLMSDQEYWYFYRKYETISKMLLGLIESQR